MQLKNKKGMELSLNIIIIAVILFIVMIVMIAIFTGKIGQVRTSLNKTESQYGQDKCKVPGTDRSCAMNEDSCRSKGGFIYPKPSGGWSDCILGQECCSA